MSQACESGDFTRSIVVANVAEFYERSYRGFPPREVAAWRMASLAVADMALFWGGDDKLVITPAPLEPAFVEDACRALGYRNVSVASPESSHASLCEAITADRTLYQRLVRIIRSSGGVELLCWGATPQLYALVERLRADAGAVSTPDVPPQEDAWLVEYLDSKAGFRDFITRSSTASRSVRLAPGVTCACADTAVGRILAALKVGVGVVAKPSRGVAGNGLQKFEGTRLADGARVRREMQVAARFSPIISSGPQVVEELIQAPFDCRSAWPSMFGIVQADGSLREAHVSEQLIHSGARYFGSVHEVSGYQGWVSDELRAMAESVAWFAADVGYRGALGVDTMVGADGRLYCLEVNARRTSSSFLYDIVGHLRGQSAACNSTVLSLPDVKLTSKQAVTFSELRTAIREAGPMVRESGRGILVTSSRLGASGSARSVGLVIFEADFEHAVSLLRRVADDLMLEIPSLPSGPSLLRSSAQPRRPNSGGIAHSGKGDDIPGP